MFSTLSIGSTRSHVTVVGVTSDGKTVPATYAKIQAVSDALETPGFSGENGEVLAAGGKHVLLGLGEPGSVTPASIRTAAAKLVKALDRRGDKGISVDLSAGFPKKRAEVEAVQAMAAKKRAHSARGEPSRLAGGACTAASNASWSAARVAASACVQSTRSAAARKRASSAAPRGNAAGGSAHAAAT